MPLSDITISRIWNHLTGTESWSLPSGLWMGYSCREPSSDGMIVEEPSDPVYARQSLAGKFAAASSRQITTNSVISFPVATEDQGGVQYLLLFDAATAGNLVAYAQTERPIEIVPGSALLVPSGMRLTLPETGSACFATSVANTILDHLVGRAVWTAPSSLTLGLSQTQPTVTGGNITEPTDPNYSRASLSGKFSRVNCRVLSNTAAVTFATSSSTWGPIEYIFLADGTTEQMVLYASCRPFTLPSGQQLVLPVYGMEIGFTRRS